MPKMKGGEYIAEYLIQEKVPYIFDAHVGGNWGTPYKGFRVVELLKDNSMITYMMNPTDYLNELSF
jgi:hypothetical protein